MPSPAPFNLTICPLTLDSIPTAEQLLDSSKALLATTPAWKRGKTIGTVQTLYRTKQKGDAAPWHCRLSTHGADDLPFEAFWAGLGTRGENEPKYVQEIKQATCLRTFEHDSRLSIWSMLYVFPAPFQPRVFTVLVGIFPPSAQEDAFYVIQAPIDVSSDPELARLNAHTEVPGINHASIVQGRYVATERIQKLKDGSTEWIMATSSNAGGNIPQFVQDMSIPTSIASDVPKFVTWAKTQPFAKKKSEGEPHPAAEAP